MRPQFTALLLLAAACGRPLDSFCIPNRVIEKDHRNAYTYVTPHSYTTCSGTKYRTCTRHYTLITHYVPEKNYVTFQSARSREVLNDKGWFDRVVVGQVLQSCYTNYEYSHVFDDGKDTTARFTNIAPSGASNPERTF